MIVIRFRTAFDVCFYLASIWSARKQYCSVAEEVIGKYEKVKWFLMVGHLE